MSCIPKKFVKPLRCEGKFDFTMGTPLRVYTHYDGVIEGEVHRNPLFEEVPSWMELVNCVRRDEEDGKEFVGLFRVHHDDIRKMEVIGEPNVFKRKTKTEKVYRTVVIEKADDFRKLMKLLVKEEVVGLNFHGVFVGRDGSVGWISLFLGNTIFCVDAIKLPEQESRFWTLLHIHFFRNECIRKVVYNSRPIADFLYHKHHIRILNVFDIQVAEFYIWSQGQSKRDLVAAKDKIKYKSLSECLETFLGEEIHPGELELLKKYEKADFSAKSPLMERPVVEKEACKYVAIDIKHLLKLYDVLVKRMLELYTNAVSAQMVDLVGGNNAVMEHVLRHPTQIMSGVFQNVVRPTGKFVEVTDASKKTADEAKSGDSKDNY